MPFKRKPISNDANFSQKKISPHRPSESPEKSASTSETPRPENPASTPEPSLPEIPSSEKDSLATPVDPADKKHLHKHHPHKHHPLLFPSITVLVGLFFLVTFLFGIYSLVKNLDFLSLLKPFSQKVQVDENNHTNIVFFGTGTIMHEGSDLTDSIIVVSLDHTHKYTALLSIPRDLFVETEYGNMRINQIYDTARRKLDSSEEGLRVATETIEKIVGLPIHYYAKIDFNGFIELVDHIDGIDIYLENDFHDPYYPKGETEEYEPFFLPAGSNHLDGEAALKYARSRHTTSDFSRSQRQQDLLVKIKEKALSSQTFTNPDRIKKIYFALSENFETSLSLREILYLAQISPQFSRQNITYSGLKNEPTLPGGFLYVPERQYYGGAFVLVPSACPYGLKPEKNCYSEIHTYANLVLENAFFMQNPPTLQVLNGSGLPGVATQAKGYLIRYGLPVLRYGNAREHQLYKTTYYLKEPPVESTAEITALQTEIIPLLQTLIPGQTSTEIPPKYLQDPYLSDAQIILEIGIDFETFYQQNKEKFYSFIFEEPASP